MALGPAALHPGLNDRVKLGAVIIVAAKCAVNLSEG